MSPSAAQTAANRANALRSTGPRTPKGKAASSLNALSHGVYAADDTILAALGAMTTPPGTSGDSMASYLDEFIAEYQPAGATEMILTRRLAALALRLDRLTDALDALIARDEHHTLTEQHRRQHAPTIPPNQVTAWAATLLRDDYHPATTPSSPDPARDPSPPADVSLPPAPDPVRTALAYTLASDYATALFRHEAVIDRRFHATLKELRATQLIRRRSTPSDPPDAMTTEQSLLQAIDQRVLRILAAHGSEAGPPKPAVDRIEANPPNLTVDRIEANPVEIAHRTPAPNSPHLTDPAREPNPASAPNHQNEPTATNLVVQPIDRTFPNLAGRQNEPTAAIPLHHTEAGASNPQNHRIEPIAASPTTHLSKPSPHSRRSQPGQSRRSSKRTQRK